LSGNMFGIKAIFFLANSEDMSAHSRGVETR